MGAPSASDSPGFRLRLLGLGLLILSLIGASFWQLQTRRIDDMDDRLSFYHGPLRDYLVRVSETLQALRFEVRRLATGIDGSVPGGEGADSRIVAIVDMYTTRISADLAEIDRARRDLNVAEDAVRFERFQSEFETFRIDLASVLTRGEGGAEAIDSLGIPFQLQLSQWRRWNRNSQSVLRERLAQERSAAVVRYGVLFGLLGILAAIAVWQAYRTISSWVRYERDAANMLRANEVSLQESVKEKETLLREIHHRVKNNLQVISGLLHFQAKKVNSTEHRRAFDECQRRLLAIMLVHDKLYQAKELSRIKFSDYLVSLVDALQQSFTDEDSRVRIRVEADPLALPIEKALPAGMIVCELLTNAMKYAFPVGREGEVCVGVTSDGGQVLIRIRDNGVGLPEDFDPGTLDSFGWRLLEHLSMQVDGKLDYVNDPGANVTVSFPILSGHANSADAARLEQLVISNS